MVFLKFKIAKLLKFITIRALIPDATLDAIFRATWKLRRVQRYENCRSGTLLLQHCTHHFGRRHTNV